MKYVDLYDPDLTCSSRTWKNWVRLSEERKLKSPPSKETECLKSEASSSKLGEESRAAERLLDCDVDNDTPRRNIDFDDLTTSFANMTLGAALPNSLDDWVESEGLLDSYIDIEEFDEQLNLESPDSPKNQDLLFKASKSP